MRGFPATKPMILIFACSPFVATSTSAHGASREEPSVLQTIPDAPELADANALRSRLEQAGARFQFTYYGDSFANPSGGVRQGFGYDGRASAIFDADLSKIAGWPGGRFRASAYQIHGSSFSANTLDNLMLVSSVEAPPSTRLFSLWFEQSFGSQASLRIGQLGADQEFLISNNANLFVNATFGWPVLPSNDLPSGGPSYPEATPGARLAVKPTDGATLRLAVFNGDPAGPGPGNPVNRDPSGLAFRLRDPAFLIGEIAYAYNQDQLSVSHDNPRLEGDATGSTTQARSFIRTQDSYLPGTIKLGAWLHMGRFADQRFNVLGGLLAISGLPPQRHRGDAAVYGVIDQAVWKTEDRSLGVFARGVATASDRNPVDLYADLGFTLMGMFPTREKDAAGAAFAIGRISPVAQASDRDAVADSGARNPIRDYEATFEASYKIAMSGQWSLQPDIQLVFHPGGHIANPVNPMSAAPIPNAVVFGLRTALRF
ncbi:carbohydrate porin [Methylocystis bryophila]|uniref:carbohydrate porin n=1 Tax=Methylocystis bryophila TaxID=655015 RepID=UPI00131A45D0|nr:carbohydrate porin [Methylocystis bryophila]BDV40249.1 porin [Methylocystis bryophila]